MNGTDLPIRIQKAEESRRWQKRRADLLHSACRHVAQQVAEGVKVIRACKITSRKFRGRSLGGGRQLVLSEKTMKRHWYTWKALRNESIFVLRYVAGRRADVDPLLIRLITDACFRESKTIGEVLRRSGIAGNRAGCLSISTIRSALPTYAVTRFIQAERRLLRERTRAERKLLKINARIDEFRASTERKLLDAIGVQLEAKA